MVVDSTGYVLNNNISTNMQRCFEPIPYISMIVHGFCYLLSLSPFLPHFLSHPLSQLTIETSNSAFLYDASTFTMADTEPSHCHLYSDTNLWHAPCNHQNQLIQVEVVPRRVTGLSSSPSKKKITITCFWFSVIVVTLPDCRRQDVLENHATCALWPSLLPPRLNQLCCQWQIPGSNDGN